LEELEQVPPGTPVAGAAELADRWRDLQREHNAIELGTTSEERAAMAELLRAELAVAEAEAVLRQPQLTPEQIRRIEAAHADYVEASDKVERRFGGGRARKLLADAEAEEARVLARFGFDSWVDYMLSTSKRAADPEMRRERADLEEARKEVAHCTGELDAIPGAVARRRRRAELSTRQDELSTEVAAMLGHQPVGADVEDELRNLCIESDRSRERDRLVAALRAVDVDPGPDPVEVDDAVAAAHRFLDTAAHDGRRREDLVAAVAALDVHLDALAEARAEGGPDLPDLPPLPDMAEPPVGLLDLVADTHVHAVPQGPPVALPPDLVVTVEEPAPPGNGLPVDPRDLAEADAFTDESPEWLDRATAWSVGPDPVSLASTDPVAGQGLEGSDPADATDTGDDPSDAAGTVDDLADGGELAAPASAGVGPPVVEPDPVDRHAVVDDVIWRAMARIADCRADGPAGHLPVVFDDPFGDLDADEVVEVLSRLSRLTDLVQLVIVSDRPEIAAWAHDLGREHALVVG
jgi:hypothetical protein